MDISTAEQKKARIISVSGRLDTNTAPELEAYLSENPNGNEKVVFDFLKLEYISSAGLRVVVATQQAASEFAIVCQKDSAVYEVFDMSGLSMMLNIAESVDDAI